MGAITIDTFTNGAYDESVPHDWLLEMAPVMITYISKAERKKKIRRLVFANSIKKAEEAVMKSTKPTAMDELLALAKKYRHLTKQ